MRKILSTIFLSLLALQVHAVTEYSMPFPQEVYGFVDSVNTISIIIDESVLPFDILGDTVKKNTDPYLVTGLKIGYLSLASNDDTFMVTISHDELVNGTCKLDYRLDVFYGNDTNQFITIYSGDANAKTISKNMSNTAFDQAPYVITNTALYISMNETAENLASDSYAPRGDYTSTITCTLEVGS